MEPYGLTTQSGAAFTGPRSSTLPVTIPTLPVAATHDWDARTLTAQDGGEVASWKSLTSMAVASTTGSKPRLKREPNGAPYVSFTAANSDTLTYAMTRPQPHAVVMLAKVRTIPASGKIAVLSGAAGSTSRTLVRINALGQIQVGDGGTFITGPAVVAGKWVVIIAEFNGASSAVTVGGVTVTGTIGGTLVADALSMARGGTDYADMDLKRLSYITGTLTPADRASLTAQ